MKFFTKIIKCVLICLGLLFIIEDFCLNHCLISLPYYAYKMAEITVIYNMDGRDIDRYMAETQKLYDSITYKFKR